MKVLKIRFQNLNSLTGEWSIDLTVPAYDGLFAITGPTGAGKSTILDAICLALYGCTPRLARITKSENEIMSRLAGECFAEVTFETENGTYVAHWAQWRARKKAIGELQAPRHELSRADGAILSNKLSEVPKEIEKLTGMNFDRFTRSMLLAQGAFAAFLQAGSDERSPILEQITGTQIYTDISKAVFERAKEEEQKLAHLSSKIEGVQLLTDEEVAKLTEEARTLTLQSNREKQSLDAFRTEMTVIEAIEKLQRDINRVAEETDTLKKKKAEFEPERIRFEAAGRAKNIEVDFVRLMSVESAQNKDKEALEESLKIKPNLVEALRLTIEGFASAESQYKAKLEEEAKARKLWEEVRSLDEKILHEKKELDEAEQSFRNLIAKLDELKKEESDLKDKKAKAEQKRMPLAAYLDAHSEDSKLAEIASGLSVELKHIRDAALDVEKADQALAASQKAIGEAKKDFEGAKAAHEKSLAYVKAAEDEHRQLLSEQNELLEGETQNYWEEKKEALRSERELRRVIQSLTDHRAHLEDGKPCPLCGALEHPYAVGNIPALEVVDKELKAVQERLKALSDIRIKIETAIQKIQTQKSVESKASVDRASKEAHFTSLEKSIKIEIKKFDELKRQYEAKNNALVKQFAKLGFENEVNDLSLLLDALKARADKWSDAKKGVESVDLTLQGVLDKLQPLSGQMLTITEDIQSREGPIQKRKDGLVERLNARIALFGEKVVADVEAQMTHAVNAAQKAQEEAQRALNTAQTNKQTQESEEIRLNNAISERATELMQLQMQFNKALEKQGFNDRETYLSARLADDVYCGLQKAADELRTREVQLATQRKEFGKLLEDKRALRTSEDSLETIVVKEKETDAHYQSVLTELGEIVGKLKINEESMKNYRELLENRTALQKAIAPWQNLRTLIGSADGKRYRNFAQGLTFDVVIGYANQQLRRMSDRYLLVRGDNESLDLNVVDNYQAAEQRSTKNLSGGESFIVSLALALGLSKMASRNVRVDSLFLDEGFGTLDDRALDLALDTLSILREDGKLIGVISHVKTLKERIGTQISVIACTGGKSRLEGPGCEQIK